MSKWANNVDLLLLATCDEILSWRIENWMKHHLVSDSNCNIVNLILPSNFFYEEWQIMLGLTFSVGETMPRFTMSIVQDN